MEFSKINNLISKLLDLAKDFKEVIAVQEGTNLAGALRFELRKAVLETAVIPFHYTPNLKH